MEIITCPCCAAEQRSTNLQPKQINYTTAVFLCPLEKCDYPGGHSWILMKRSWVDLMPEVHSEKKQKYFFEDALQADYDSDELTDLLDNLNKISDDIITKSNHNLTEDSQSSLISHENVNSNRVTTCNVISDIVMKSEQMHADVITNTSNLQETAMTSDLDDVTSHIDPILNDMPFLDDLSFF